MKEFSPGDILYAEDLNTIVTQIEDVSLSVKSINDTLLEKIQEITYNLECRTADLSNFSYTTTFPTSVFSGWASYLGCPEKIDRIKTTFTVRANKPVSSVRIVLYEMPEASQMTFAENKRSYTPRLGNTGWRTLYTHDKTFAEPYTSAGVRTLTIDFENTIVNTNNKHLCIGIYFDNLVTMGYVTKVVNDAPFNPCIYYTTNGGYALSLISGGNNYREYDDPNFWCIPVECYSKQVSREYMGINIGRGGRFNKAVIDSINNSDTFSTVFSEKNVPSFLFGSQNLFTSKTSSKTSLTSTFTGRLHVIGKLDPSYEVKGVRLRICPRVWQGAGGHCTKVHAYLYTINRLPIGTDSLNFSQLGASLVASGEVECDIEAETVQDVEIYFGNTFINEDEKYVALGFNCDTYCHMMFANGTASGTVGSLDGSTYTAMDAYYSVATGGTPAWSRVWRDDKLFAYSLFTYTKQFDFGEGFYDFVNNAIQEYIDGGGGGGDDEEEEVAVAPTSEVVLPKQYDLVVGDTFQLFYEGVIKSFDVLEQGIRVICSVGDQYPRYYQFTPAAEHAGHEYTLTVTTRLLDGRVISTGSTKLVVHPKLTNATTPTNTNVLIFGDSLTSACVWGAEGLRRIYGATNSGASGPTALGLTNTVTTYGTKTNTNNTFQVHHEGYGGWTWNSFLATTSSTSTISQMTIVLPSAHGLDLNTVQKSIWTDNNNLQWELEDFPSASSLKFNRGPGNDGAQSTITLPTSMSCSTFGLSYNSFIANWGSTNPFYDDITGQVSFTAHAARFNNPGPDIVACLLTWNGASINANFKNSSGINTHMAKAKILLTKIHTDYPNAKIIVMGIQISSLTGGSGANYHATGSYSDYWSSAFYAFDYDKALEELVTEDMDLMDYCYYVDTKGQFDTRYNMPYNNVAVNTRKTNVTEMRGTNGVHPSGEGYYQIGDAFYRKLTAILPTLVSNNNE